MPLDSDVTGADERLFVKIYQYDRVGPDLGKTYIRIMAPGQQLNIIDRPIRDTDKRRFPRHWAAYDAQSGDATIGIDLGLWHKERPDDLTSGQLEALRGLRFSTVEQVALASDGQLQNIGMGGIGLRVKARGYLDRMKSGPDPEVADLKAQNAAMLARMEEMAGQMAALMASPPKAKSGRPPKVKPEAAAATA